MRVSRLEGNRHTIVMFMHKYFLAMKKRKKMCWRLHDKEKKNEWKINCAQPDDQRSTLFAASPLYWVAVVVNDFFKSRDDDRMIGSSWAVESKLLSWFNSSTKTNSTQSSNYQLSESFFAKGFLLCSYEKLISSFYFSQQAPDGGWRKKSYFLFQSSLETFHKSLIILKAFIEDFFSGFQLLSSILRTLTGIVNLSQRMLSLACWWCFNYVRQSTQTIHQLIVLLLIFNKTSVGPRSYDVVNYIHDFVQRGGERHSEN